MNLGCSSKNTGTSSSATETKSIPSHVVNLKESKTHMFYVIQSNNESHAFGQHLVELKVSKEIPLSRKFVSKKMRLGYGNSSDDVTDETREKSKRLQIPSRLASIHKRTDHPSFVVLPQMLGRRRFNIRQNVEKNQSTSENSNETYVIRSRDDNSKSWGSKGKVPLLYSSLWKRNSETFLHGLANAKSEEYCECDKGTANKSSRDSLNFNDKIETLGSAHNTSKGYLKKEDQFNINFATPIQKKMPQRLRAGQDYDKRYKSCYICPNIKRIFPPATGSRRPTAESGSNSTLNNRSGYAKINFKLVRQCLIHGSVNEKTEILDAIRLRMKSSDSNVAIGTIEDIVKFDLFGVQCECRSKPLLEDLFWPLTPSFELQTSIAQFVNALVSYKLGRSYFNNKSVIRMLTYGDIGRDNIDPIMGDNLMGIMMKLSFSRFQRTDMIENDLIRWLLQHMQEKEYSVTKYHLQCMAGLLRNLLRGYNLENLSPTEMQNLIVLLGRYLDNENETAKRYICDSLVTLFQNQTCVARAKNLNFQRVIQEHVTNAPNPAQREHLSAIYRLLNRSASSTSFKTPKFDVRSEEETFLDADLESDGKVDCYPGECLIREKFNSDAGAQRQEKTADESNAIASDESEKDGRLISRVFVEHLNCFLPNIENNRIFPLCNSRCADKIGACSHVGDIQPKKRQPYIPPNSRLPRQKQNLRVSVEEALEKDFNKSTKKSKPSDEESKSVELLNSRISTISHDTTATKWNQIGKGDRDAKVPTSVSTDTGQMEKIFDSHSIKTNDALEGEHLITTESYRQESFGAADVVNERTRKNDESKMDTAINDQWLLNQQSTHVENETNNDGELATRTETKNREESQRDNKSVEALELTEGQKISGISGALTQRTSSPIRAKQGLHTTVSEQKKEKLNEISPQQNLHLHSDEQGRRKSSLSSSFDANDYGQKHLTDEVRFKESSANRDIERGETSKLVPADDQVSSSKSANRLVIARHSSEDPISQQSTSERKQVQRTGRGIYSKSEVTSERKQMPRTLSIGASTGILSKSNKTLTNLGRYKKSSQKNEVTEMTQETLVKNEAWSQPRTLSIEDSPGKHSKSDMTLTNLGRHKKSSQKNEVTGKTQEAFSKNVAGHQFTVRSNEVVVKSRTDQDQLLNARSEGLVIPIGTTSKDNAKINESKTRIVPKVRSEEGVRNQKSRGDKAQEGLTNQNLDLILQARSEAALVKTAMDNKMTLVKSDKSSVSDVQTAAQINARSAIMIGAVQGLTSGNSEDTVTQEHTNIVADETDNKLNVRSQTLLTKQLETNVPSPSSLIERRTVNEDIVTHQIRNPQMHARSMEILKNHESHQLIKKSKSDVVNSDANRCHTKTQYHSASPPSPEPTTNTIGRKLPARSVEYERTNYQLLKSSSDDLLGSTRNQDYSLEPSRMKLLNQLAVRSNEFVKQIGKTQSANMFEGLTRSRDRLNSSGNNSSQSSKHCVDCRGNGYVLRERPSQPCDRCKDSLSRYPNFIDALANNEYQRRDVTRTGDEWIKITLVNKSNEKMNSMSNQETPNKEKFSGSNDGENSDKAKGNADIVLGTSGTTEKQKPTEMSNNQQSENIASVEDSDGDAIVESSKHSFNEKSNAMTTAEHTAITVEVQSVTDELLLSDGIKEIVPTRSVDCTKNAPSAASSAKLIQEDVEDEKLELTPHDKTRENSQLPAVVENRTNSISERFPVETNGIFKSDLQPDINQPPHHNPEQTETKNNQHSTDETRIDQSVNQVVEKDDEVTPARSNERTTEKDELEESKNGSRDVQIEYLKYLNRTVSVDEVADSGYNQFSSAASGNEVSKVDVNVTEEVVVSKRSELPLPDSVNLLQEMNLANLVETPIPRGAIGPATDNQNLNDETSVAAEVTNHEGLNLSSNVATTSDDNHFRQTIIDRQLSERRMSSPVVAHLFPRSIELNSTGVIRSRPVDNVKGVKSLDESENATEKLLDLKEPASECGDDTEDIELKDKGQLSSKSNAKLGNPTLAKHSKPENEKWSDELIAMETNVYQKCSEQQSFSDVMNNRQDNEISLNPPCTAAKSVENPVSLTVEITEPMNDGKPNAEATVSGYDALPAGSTENVRNEIASVPPDNEVAVSESLENEYLNVAVGMTGDDPVLPVTSKENATPRKQDDFTFVPVSFGLMSVANENRTTKSIATTKPSLLLPRSNDVVVASNVSPAKNQKPDETKTVEHNKNVDTKKKLTVPGEDGHKGSSAASVRKLVDNKSSTVLDEILNDQQNLRSDKKSTKVHIPDDTEIDQELSLEGFGYFSDGVIEKGRHKARAVNSTCCRQLLNNDELINRLSEKVLEKLKNKIHRCGPNCKSPCGRFNSYLKAQKDNNLNWE